MAPLFVPLALRALAPELQQSDPRAAPLLVDLLRAVGLGVPRLLDHLLLVARDTNLACALPPAAKHASRSGQQCSSPFNGDGVGDLRLVLDGLPNQLVRGVDESAGDLLEFDQPEPDRPV